MENYKILIDGYFAQSSNDNKLTKALESYLCHYSYAMVTGGPAKDAINKYLTKTLGEYWYDCFNNLYDNGFERIADHQELVDMGYYIKISDTMYKTSKEIDHTKATSYRELKTFEEVFNHYYPELSTTTT